MRRKAWLFVGIVTIILVITFVLDARRARADSVCDKLERDARALLETGKESFVQYNLLKFRALDPGITAYLKQEHIKTALAYHQRLTASQVRRITILDRIEDLDCQGDRGIFVVIPATTNPLSSDSQSVRIFP